MRIPLLAIWCITSLVNLIKNQLAYLLLPDTIDLVQVLLGVLQEMIVKGGKSN